MSITHSEDRSQILRFWRHLNINKLFSNEKFQFWASNLPIFKRLARAEGEAIFDLIMGFVNAQVLWVLVELGILRSLINAPRSIPQIAADISISEERTEILMNAAAALGLVKRKKQRFYALSRKGASLLGVPGLIEIIKHHAHFYRDMADPIALLRDEVDTELSRFWPYVFGVTDETSKIVTEKYSNLMASSLKLVAHDTLKMAAFKPDGDVLDVGGGSGNFAIEVARKFKGVKLSIFDLPQVERSARQQIQEAGFENRIRFIPGSFCADSFPQGFDTVTLIRVLYDHGDITVSTLLKKIYCALPEGGRLIISEPMSGGDQPNRAGDVYFAFYTMAMRTGKSRSPNQIADMCNKVGFKSVFVPKPPRKFITSAVVCVK